MARRDFVPLDTGFRWDDKVNNLGEDFGAPGVVAALMLITQAKQQKDAGDVRYGWRGWARAICADTEQGKDILAAAAQEGLISIIENDGDGFLAHVRRYADWNPKDPTGAARQARYRDRHGPLRNASRNTEESREEEKRNIPAERLKAIDGEGKVVRSLFDYWRACCAHPQAKFTYDRQSKVRARLREGYTPEQVRKAIDGAAKAPYVNDHGKRFDDLELVCRTGTKLEDFMARSGKAQPPSSGQNVVHMARKCRRCSGETEHGAAFCEGCAEIVAGGGDAA